MAVARMVDISLLGDKALARKLHRLSVVTQRKVVRPALRAGAKPVLATALELVHRLTGGLAATLKIRALPRNRRGFFGVQVRTGTRRELGIAEDDPNFWPMALEYGHRSNWGGRVPPYPYLRPAMDQNRGKATRIIMVEIAQGILREARRA